MRPIWKIVKLEDIADVERGKFSARPRNDPKYYGGDIPFLQTGDVASVTGTILSFSQTLNKKGLQVSKLFPAGTLLITIAANIGDVAEVGFDFACPDSLVAVQPHEGVNKSWLKYFLQIHKSYFKAMATQNAQANINLQVIKPLPVLLPPQDEQNEIANILLCGDQSIEKMERLIEEKEHYIKYLFDYLIFDPANNNKRWTNVRICDIADRVQRKSDEREYPVLTISSAAGFVLQEDKYSRFMPVKSIDNYILLRRGEFAYNKGNSLRYQFGCVFRLDSYDAALVPHVYVCFNVHEGIDSDYLSYVFKADILRRQLRPLVNTGVRNNGLLNINPDTFMKVNVPLPPLAEQKRISKITSVPTFVFRGNLTC